MIEAIIAKVQQLLNRVGQSTDASSSTGSLHAKVSDVKSTLNTVNSNMATSSAVNTLATSTQATNIQSTANSINSNMATATQATNIQNTVNTLATSTQATNIQSSVNSIPTSMIKSVQRGTVSVAGNGGTATVTISSVNTTKAMLFPTSFGNPYNGASVITGQLTNSTTLTFTNPTPGQTITVSWEVIEYV